MAQAIDAIGPGRAAVVDLSPAGADPAQLALTPSQTDQVHLAGLVVEVGGGYQPALAKAAAGRPNVVALASALRATNPAVWLDPTLMEKATPILGAAMIRADPSAASTIKNGEADFNDELESLDIDYQNTLSDCPSKAIVTPDDAFRPTAARYGFTDVIVGVGNDPSPTQVERAAASIRSSGATTVFTESWAANGLAVAAANAAHVKVRSIDTLVGPPPKGWPAGATYFALIEQDLSAIKSALQCADMDN